jgi:hypothetical protein
MLSPTSLFPLLLTPRSRRSNSSLSIPREVKVVEEENTVEGAFPPFPIFPRRSLTLLYAVTSRFDALPNELIIRILSIVLPTRAKGSLAILLLCKRFYELGRPNWLSTWVFRTDDPNSREKLATLASRRSLHAFVVDLMAFHPSFRLVMTLDVRNGELSRPIRNRGIEIAVLPSAVSPATADYKPTLSARRVRRTFPYASHPSRLDNTVPRIRR